MLDLFAGSGSFGIECISRGAKDVTFVDRSKDSIALVYQNLKGVDGDYRVVNADFASVLRSSYVSGKKYDLIFLDPPYATTLAELAIDLIVELDLLTEDGVIVFEHGSEKSYEIPHVGFKQRTKKMGTITAEFITRKSVALMAGSFDPFTKGHESVLDEALAKYDEVWVACLVNPDKTYTFSPRQRLAIVNAVCEFKKARTRFIPTNMPLKLQKKSAQPFSCAESETQKTFRMKKIWQNTTKNTAVMTPNLSLRRDTKT